MAFGTVAIEQSFLGALQIRSAAAQAHQTAENCHICLGLNPKCACYTCLMNLPTLPDSTHKLFLLMAFVIVAWPTWGNLQADAKWKEQVLVVNGLEIQLAQGKELYEAAKESMKVEVASVQKLVKQGKAAPELWKEIQVTSWKRSNEEYWRLKKLETDLAVERLKAGEFKAETSVSWYTVIMVSVVYALCLMIGLWGWANQQRQQRNLVIAQTLEALSNSDEAVIKKHRARLERELTILNFWSFIRGSREKTEEGETTWTAVKPEPGHPENS